MRGCAEVTSLVEVLGADVLLDGDLLHLLGPVDARIIGAIVGICDDALTATLGPVIVEAISTDCRLVPLVAPWTIDLARGLLVLSCHGPGELRTTELLDLFSNRRLADEERARCVEAIDLAVALTLDRVLEHVLGPGGCTRVPGDNEVAAPWLPALKYGHRVHLTLELLRLLPAG